jgi:hypothetical protein
MYVKPNGVISIHDIAFSDCSNLVNVTIPNGVTSIGNQAFYNCSSLASATLPNSVTNIGNGAFGGCSSLINIGIPNGVTSIVEGFCWGCSSLISIDIPNGVMSIGGAAFQNCSSLASITIPNSVTSIGSLAFYDCSSFTSITIPNSVTSIEEKAFQFCISLASVKVKWNTPLNVNNIFYFVNLNSVTLHVPPGTKPLYEAAPVWQDFGTIVEDASLTSGEENSVNITDPEATASSDIRAYVSNNRLYVSSPSAEQIGVYSLGGSLVYSVRKDAGAATFDISHLPKGVWIVKCSSGWTGKVVKL